MALKKTWMKGCPVTVDKISSMFPKVKIRVIAITKPRAVLSTTDHIIAFGRVIEAS